MIVNEIVPQELANKRLRVCAYARVSADNEDMMHSLSAQVSHYNDMISSNPKWIFAGIYADGGLSGTKTNRPEFQRMIQDCKNGKIDLIVTKSISRFSRNTIVMLETIRMLDEMGIDVYFEEQQMNIKSGKGELMLTIIGSFAQEEARQVSENMKWRIKKDFEKGILWGGNNPYGYIIDRKEKRLVVNPEQAKVVRLIFEEYLDGKGASLIAKKLNKMGFKTMMNSEWNNNVVMAILKNEVYTGDLLLQKTYRENYLTKKTLKNKGELQQYYVEDDHEPIITHEMFEETQRIRNERIKKFKNKISYSNKAYPFTGIIKCSCCGSTFNHKTTKYNKLWICKTFNMKGKEYCQESKQIDESKLYEAINKYFGWDCFKENDFKTKVEYLIAKPNNEIEMHFKDGNVAIIKWEDRSRSESWTSEMKEKARQKTIEQYKKRGGGLNG